MDNSSFKAVKNNDTESLVYVSGVKILYGSQTGTAKVLKSSVVCDVSAYSVRYALFN